MNAEKLDELFERSEFSSGRHSSVRRREPAKGGQDGRGLRHLIQNLGEQILVVVRGRDPGVLVRSKIKFGNHGVKSWLVQQRNLLLSLPYNIIAHIRARCGYEPGNDLSR